MRIPGARLAPAAAIVGLVLTILLGVAAVVAGPRLHIGQHAGPGPLPTVIPPEPPTGPQSVTVLAAGDVLLHEALWFQAAADARAMGGQGYQFGPIFEAVTRDIRAADLAICHLETPLGAVQGPFSGYPTFSVPPQIAAALAGAGFDSCSTASNHTLDAGERGVYRTLDALDDAGLRHAGSYRSAAQQATPTTVRVKSVAVAHLSYTFSFNGLHPPAGRAWIANLIDPAAVVAEAVRARAAGAEIVIVSLHWGEEYRHTPSQAQVALARELLARPEIDLILGTHAHVVQPFERIAGKWVVYGMGNEIARQADGYAARREGVMPVFTFTRVAAGTWTVTAVQAISTWIDFAPQIRIANLSVALADPAIGSALRSTYATARARIRSYVLSRSAPVTVR
jgi:poly-gamma-glutamate capsule biosynthesis protein CapA/YwtB (metallophosphatase superfamily)